MKAINNKTKTGTLKRFKWLGCLVLNMLICLSSCVTNLDYLDDNNQNITNQETNVILRVEIPRSLSQPSTRALSTEQEQDIETIHVFAFKKSGNNLTLQNIVEGLEITQNSTESNITTFKALLMTSTNSEDTYCLVVVANAKDIIESIFGSALDFSAVQDGSYDGIQKLIIGEIEDKMFLPSDSSAKPMLEAIPMCGITSLIEIKPSMDLNIRMVRSISRIDVGVGSSIAQSNGTWKWSGKQNDGVTVIPFKMTEVYVIQPNNKYAVLPELANMNDNKANKPSLVAGATNFPIDETGCLRFLYDGENITSQTIDFGSYTTQSIYIPESDILMSATGTSGDANHLNRMAIVVGGSYNGSPISYYRLDFLDSKKNLLNALRNHLYQFNITSVKGIGYPTPIEAFKALPINMTVEVVEWNDSDISDIVIDDQYHFGVSRSTIELPKVAHDISSDYNKLKITTDYPMGWKVESKNITDENGAEVQWLWPENSIGGIGTTEVSIIAEENTTSVDRIAYMTFEAGRLNYKLKIVQEALDPPLFVVLWDKSSAGGVYKSGQALVSTNKINLIVDVQSIGDGDYNITTNTIDGISFNSSGIFTQLGEQTIELQGSGIPVGNKTKRMVVNPNNGDAKGIIPVRMILPKKNILSVGESAWALNGSNAGIAKMFSSPYNFGEMSNSIYKAYPPEFLNSSLIYGSFATSTFQNLLPDADIVSLSYSNIWNSTAGSIMLDYVRSGGVLIMEQENFNTDVMNFINNLLGTNMTYVSDGGRSGTIWRLPDVDNSVFNGPFGDVRGKYVGEDNGYTDYLIVTDEDKQKLDWWVDAYDYSGDVANSGRIIGFKAKGYNFIWWGDGGLSSGTNSGSTVTYPVVVGGAPEYKIGTKVYGYNRSFYVDNGTFFANILTWAIEQAEFEGKSTRFSPALSPNLIK
ncbi:MAG: hypothetical protein ACK5HZ_11035 [Macellibacteroides fermentans]|uniref:hypothetical protein n=1 Tax=Macellibacteroides fermentans TaxID=879969 RepID=UPI003AC92CC8